MIQMPEDQETRSRFSFTAVINSHELMSDMGHGTVILLEPLNSQMRVTIYSRSRPIRREHRGSKWYCAPASAASGCGANINTCHYVMLAHRIRHGVAACVSNCVALPLFPISGLISRLL